MGDVLNPYEAPRADGDADVRPAYAGDLVDATRGVRFANLLIDSFFRGILGAVIALIARTAKEPGLSVLLGLASLVSYYVFFEAVLGATPGKMITRTRVVSVDGSKPSFMQILGRTFSRLVPFEPFSFFSSTQEGWHDRWSRTRVVRR